MATRRHLHSLLLFVAVPALIYACSCGCGGVGREAAARDALPDWVRVLAPEKDGRSQFVGGVSMADDLETGLEAATADARSQVYAEAARRAGVVISRGSSRSDIETTAVERLDIRNRVNQMYGSAMEESATRDQEYYRPCGGAEGESPVCSVFVLVSVDSAAWDRVLGDTFETLRWEWEEEGSRNKADLAVWILEHLVDPQRERDHD
jgi:hypothetical protein